MLPYIDYDFDVEEGDPIITLDNPNEPFAFWIEEAPSEVPQPSQSLLDGWLLRRFRKVDPTGPPFEEEPRMNEHHSMSHSVLHLRRHQSLKNRQSIHPTCLCKILHIFQTCQKKQCLNRQVLKTMKSSMKTRIKSFDYH